MIKLYKSLLPLNPFWRGLTIQISDFSVQFHFGNFEVMKSGKHYMTTTSSLLVANTIKQELEVLL